MDVFAQSFAKMDKSPADIVTFRPGKGEAPVAKIVYSRPQKKGRDIFGDLVPYGKVWRLGANECTEIRFFRDVKLGDADVKAGSYAMFAIPGEETGPSSSIRMPTSGAPTGMKRAKMWQG